MNAVRMWRIEPDTLAGREARAHRRIAAKNPERAEQHLQAAELLDPPSTARAVGDYARDWSGDVISGKVPPPTLAQIEQSTREHNEKSEWFER